MSDIYINYQSLPTTVVGTTLQGSTITRDGLGNYREYQTGCMGMGVGMPVYKLPSISSYFTKDLQIRDQYELDCNWQKKRFELP